MGVPRVGVHGDVVTGRKKPGPKPVIPRLKEGRDYYCGWCAGHGTVSCPDCIGGCRECGGSGTVRCESCKGGTVPLQPPDWV